MTKEFLDEILKIFPIELLNKFDVYNKTETNILISSSNFNLAKYLIKNFNLIYSNPEIFKLPKELIEFIFSFSTLNENYLISMTCKKLFKISNSNILWQFLCNKRFEYKEELFRNSFKNLYRSFLNSNLILNANSKNNDFLYGPFFQKSFCNKDWREFKIEKIINDLILNEFKQKTINLNHKFIKEDPNLELILENEYYDELLNSIKNFKKNKKSCFKKVEKYWRDEIKKKDFIEVDENKLAEQLGCGVVKVDGRSGIGIDKLLSCVKPKLSADADENTSHPFKAFENISKEKLISMYSDIERIERNVIVPIKYVSQPNIKKANEKLKIR